MGPVRRDPTPSLSAMYECTDLDQPMGMLDVIEAKHIDTDPFTLSGSSEVSVGMRK